MTGSIGFALYKKKVEEIDEDEVLFSINGEDCQCLIWSTSKHNDGSVTIYFNIFTVDEDFSYALGRQRTKTFARGAEIGVIFPEWRPWMVNVVYDRLLI